MISEASRRCKIGCDRARRSSHSPDQPDTSYPPSILYRGSRSWKLRLLCVALDFRCFHSCNPTSDANVLPSASYWDQPGRTLKDLPRRCDHYQKYAETGKKNKCFHTRCLFLSAVNSVSRTSARRR